MEYLTGIRAFPANALRHTSKADVVDVSQSSFPSSACNKSNGICLWCTWHNGNLLNYCFFTLPLPTVQSIHYFISSWKGLILSGIFQPKSLLPMFQVENQSVVQSAGVAKVMTELKFVFVFSMLCHVQLQYNILLGNL